MPTQNIGATIASDLTNTQTDWTVTNVSTDGVTDQKETTWVNENWTKWYGYYRSIPEIRVVIDTKATWTVGKGFITDSPENEGVLWTLKGIGKDTFNTFLENAIRTYHIGGDFYAEILRDDDGELINLKPLSPDSMRHVVNRQGQLIRFEQISKVKTPDKKFAPEKIFYLARNRTADEIHGISMIEALQDIIDSKKEAMSDMKVLMHRHVKPMRVWHLGTDDTTEIAGFKTTIDKATENAENIYVPQGTVEFEVAAVPTNATLNPLPWITYLDNMFYEVAGVPKIIVGGSGEFTEATAKIAYLAFQQTIEEEQLFIEEQIALQLGIEIKLQFPASLENELLSDNKKDGDQTTQPNETTAGSGQ